MSRRGRGMEADGGKASGGAGRFSGSPWALTAAPLPHETAPLDVSYKSRHSCISSVRSIWMPFSVCPFYSPDLCRGDTPWPHLLPIPLGSPLNRGSLWMDIASAPQWCTKSLPCSEVSGKAVHRQKCTACVNQTSGQRSRGGQCIKKHWCSAGTSRGART